MKFDDMLAQLTAETDGAKIAELLTEVVPGNIGDAGMLNIDDAPKYPTEVVTSLKYPTYLRHPDYIAYHAETDRQDAMFRSVMSIEHQEGGGEGQGEHVEEVLRHIPTGKLFQKVGFYESYNGTTWGDEWFEVRAEPYTATRYVKA